MESYQKQGGAAGTINPQSAKSVHCETCTEGKPDVDAGGRGGRRERAEDRGEGPVRGRCLPLQTGRDSGLGRGQVYLFAVARRSSIRRKRPSLKVTVLAAAPPQVFTSFSGLCVFEDTTFGAML